MDTDDTESWTVEWEDHHKAPYMHKGVKWVSYDDQESIRIKSYFAYQQGLAGVMTWSIDTDDFRGKCGGPTYPLLRTINNALYEKENGYHSAASTRAGSPMVSLQILTTLLFLRAARIWGRRSLLPKYDSVIIFWQDFQKTMDTNIITLKQQSHHDVLYLVIFVCRRVFMYSRSRTNIVFFVPTTNLSIIDFKRKSETSSIEVISRTYYHRIHQVCYCVYLFASSQPSLGPYHVHVNCRQKEIGSQFTLNLQFRIHLYIIQPPGCTTWIYRKHSVTSMKTS